jgi:hypothetical protein
MVPVRMLSCSASRCLYVHGVAVVLFMPCMPSMSFMPLMLLKSFTRHIPGLMWLAGS